MNENVKAPNDALPEGISAALDKLLANPQLMSMVSSALGGSPPVTSQGNSETEAEGEQAVPASAAPSFSSLPSIDTLMPIIGRLSNTADAKSSFKHEALLCAIKPYLSQRRCQAIDGIIRISKMSAIVRQLK